MLLLACPVALCHCPLLSRLAPARLRLRNTLALIASAKLLLPNSLVKGFRLSFLIQPRYVNVYQLFI